MFSYILDMLAKFLLNLSAKLHHYATNGRYLTERLEFEISNSFLKRVKAEVTVAKLEKDGEVRNLIINISYRKLVARLPRTYRLQVMFVGLPADCKKFVLNLSSYAAAMGKLEEAFYLTPIRDGKVLDAVRGVVVGDEFWEHLFD